MNKINSTLILALAFLFLPINNSEAMYTGSCTQKVQAAISMDGKCTLFSNPCNVPDEWKHISSCENFTEETEGKDLEEINKRRFDISKWRARKKTTTPEKKERILQRRLTGGTWNRISSKKADLSKTKKAIKVFSGKKYFSRKLFEDGKEKTQTRYQRTNRKRIATASAPREKGTISTTKWSTNKNSHFRKKDYSKQRVWRSMSSIRSEQRRANKKEYVPRSATLRRVWVGEKRSGSLED